VIDAVSVAEGDRSVAQPLLKLAPSGVPIITTASETDKRRAG
jgi:hypothetical protein